MSELTVPKGWERGEPIEIQAQGGKILVGQPWRITRDFVQGHVASVMFVGVAQDEDLSKWIKWWFN